MRDIFDEIQERLNILCADGTPATFMATLPDGTLVRLVGFEETRGKPVCNEESSTAHQPA